MLLMCRFLLQKKYALNALDFVGLLRHIFPRKIPPNNIPQTLHHPRRHICGRVCHHGKNGAGTALCFALAQVCASGVIVAVSL